MSRNEQQPIYESPKVQTIEIKVQSMLCQSHSGGNTPMYEVDYGDGGFTEV